MVDTHRYDGQLNRKLLDVDHVSSLSLNEKRHRGQELLSMVKLGCARPFLITIISDMGTCRNYDPSNNLWADDLICLGWNHRMNVDFIRELELQLLDMRTGFCPQGRTHRLFQTLLAFRS